MKIAIAAVAAAALLAGAAPDAVAQGKQGAGKPVCLNALVCGPQPVKQIRKPKNEKFMRSAN
ncbi:MAG: hypothetical protein ABWY35_11115 [Pseudorhodoplanes sp.]